MKMLGIALLFGLCCLIGVRLGARKTTGLLTVRSLKNELQLFSEQVTAKSGTLNEIAKNSDGLLSDVLQSYLAALSNGASEGKAAEEASEILQENKTLQAGVRMFLTGLSEATRLDLIKRTQVLSSTLDRAESEAEAEARKARVLRISGVLAGAGLAILLL